MRLSIESDFQATLGWVVSRASSIKSSSTKTDGKYEVVEGVYDSYCDRFEQPYTDYDFNTAHQFDSALEADDYARKRFFELQKEERNEKHY